MDDCLSLQGYVIGPLDNGMYWLLTLWGGRGASNQGWDIPAVGSMFGWHGGKKEVRKREPERTNEWNFYFENSTWHVMSVFQMNFVNKFRARSLDTSSCLFSTHSLMYRISNIVNGATNITSLCGHTHHSDFPNKARVHAFDCHSALTIITLWCMARRLGTAWFDVKNGWYPPTEGPYCSKLVQ